MDLVNERRERLGAETCDVERIFTEREKQELAGQSFRGQLDRVDFARADLRCARFASASLSGCDFSDADLRGAHFLACDIRDARFGGAAFGDNRFDETLLSRVQGAEGLRETIERAGGFFTPDGSSDR
jgi:uncharacterized protein YjbI with pentapeptide repeats